MPTAGVDEAGRGSLAGPVVAAAVILDPKLDKSIFRDSKQISATQREAIFRVLLASQSVFSIGLASHELIDRINIRQATHVAMLKAVRRLKVRPRKVLIDGVDIPEGLTIQAEALIRGDGSVPCISAASIVAKVLRDRLMMKYARFFPEYRLDSNKGYGTKAHVDAILHLGRIYIHRQTFQVVQQKDLFD